VFVSLFARELAKRHAETIKNFNLDDRTINEWKNPDSSAAVNILNVNYLI
jgi:hypothetical protein